MLSTYREAKKRGGLDLFGALIWLDSDAEYFARYEEESNFKLEETAVGKAISKVGEVGNNVVSGVKDSFDIVSWVVSNWQLAIVGGLAFILLIKRL